MNRSYFLIIMHQLTPEYPVRLIHKLSNAIHLWLLKFAALTAQLEVNRHCFVSHLQVFATVASMM